MDVAAAETWVNELDKIFEVIGRSDKQKAKQINGGMTSRMMTAEEKADLTRQAFQDRFFTKHFPPNVKESIESDFVRIAQHPNETITEYEERFARVSRFAPHIVQDQRHHARKFRDGLCFEIRRQMSILDNPTYAQVVDGAQCLDRLQEEQLRIWEDKRKRRDHNESNSGGGRKPSSDAKRRPIETWVNELDKIFEVMGCSDKQKAKQINGGMTSRMMTAEEKADLTRQAFQDRFFTKYFPPNVKEAIERDFVRIAQHANEMITEYEQRFARVSRFAPYIVQDERHRAHAKLFLLNSLQTLRPIHHLCVGRLESEREEEARRALGLKIPAMILAQLAIKMNNLNGCTVVPHEIALYSLFHVLGKILREDAVLKCLPCEIDQLSFLPSSSLRSSHH
ncbi:hypothetical protein RJ640_024598 [Escallonia rubra]|uniref:Retrotransposon gag domain-containing protein n=1 Tax=Escallonia rubra TaxID=112253 RepID=A0AA88UR00_9ASTE|nr:hypothetical protein RJ640_024598 [Escallonia rubra]